MMEPDSLETIHGRRSIRRYLDREVPPSLIRRVIEAAAQAPSAHNEQPWYFFVITSAQERRRLAQSMARRYERDMEAEGVQAPLRRRRIERSLSLLTAAPVHIVSYMTFPAAAERGGREEEILRIQSVAVANGYLLLAAASLGLGACWFSAPLYCAEELEEVTQSSATLEGGGAPQALITLGYPAEEPAARERKPVEEVMSHV